MTRPKRPAHKRNLTELYVRKLRPQNSAFVVWDARQHGLALRMQAVRLQSLEGDLQPPRPPALAPFGQCRRHWVG
jgi:hypothetical protein